MIFVETYNQFSYKFSLFTLMPFYSLFCSYLEHHNFSKPKRWIFNGFTYTEHKIFRCVISTFIRNYMWDPIYNILHAISNTEHTVYIIQYRSQNIQNTIHKIKNTLYALLGIIPYMTVWEGKSRCEEYITSGFATLIPLHGTLFANFL